MKNKFNIGDIVKHKSGTKYVIVATPKLNFLLEKNAETFYSYISLINKITWYRCKTEMEDGRLCK